MNSFYLFLILLLPLHFVKLFNKKNLFNAAKTDTLKLESRAETENTICTIYHLNSGAVKLTTIALLISNT